MSAGLTGPVRPELALHRDAAAVHETLLEAVNRRAFGASSALLLDLLEQHGPSHTTVGALFAAHPDPPVCQGCDRADLTPTRDPPWPCRTYRRIAESLEPVALFDPPLSPKAKAVLVRLDEHRTPAGRGSAEARHRGPRPVDAAADEGQPGIRLVRKDAE